MPALYHVPLAMLYLGSAGPLLICGGVLLLLGVTVGVEVWDGRRGATGV